MNVTSHSIKSLHIAQKFESFFFLKLKLKLLSALNEIEKKNNFLLLLKSILDCCGFSGNISIILLISHHWISDESIIRITNMKSFKVKLRCYNGFLIMSAHNLWFDSAKWNEKKKQIRLVIRNLTYVFFLFWLERKEVSISHV